MPQPPGVQTRARHLHRVEIDAGERRNARLRLSTALLACAVSLGAQTVFKGELVRHEVTTRITRACPAIFVSTTGPATRPAASRDLKLTDTFACESMEFTGPGGSLGEIGWDVPAGALTGTVAANNTPRINLEQALAYKANYRGTATLASASSTPPRLHNAWVDITPSGFPAGTTCPPASVARSTNEVGGTMDLNTSLSCQIGALQISRVLSPAADPLTEFEARMTTTVVVDSGHVNTRCCSERGGKTEVTIQSVYKFVTDEVPLPSNPHTARQPTDTRFVRTSGSGLKTPCTPTSTSPLRILLGVTRAVGKVGGNGDLDDPAILIAKGVVTSWARLRLPVGSIGASNLRVTHTVLLNGVDIDYKSAVTRREVARGAYELLVIDFPIWAVRFPARAAIGDTPTPRDNEILISSLDHTGRTLCSQVDWAELSIGALAPVIMVHGNGQGDDGAGGKFWEGEVFEVAGRPRFNMGFRFVDALEHIPYDNSISMITASTGEHADVLEYFIPTIAGSFGARHAHLVAHSKGGLDSRAFMVQTIPPNFGILSLSTLSTPHQGSPGPDYQIDSQGAWASYSDDTTRTVIGQSSPPNAGTASIRVSGAAEFNAGNVPRLPKQFVVDGETDPVAYRSVSADMNRDDSQGLTGPTIQYEETFALGQADMNATKFQLAVEQAYRLVGYVVSTYPREINHPEYGRFKIVREKLRTDFHLNDVAVTRESANCWTCAPDGGPGPFQEIAHLKRNHSTIAHPETGILVLNEIRRIQPMPPNP